MLLKIIKLIFYLFYLFSRPVYGDNFDGTTDVANNQYLQTIAFAVSDYPSIKGILYEKNQFVAEDTDLILANGHVESYVDFDGMRRIPMVADHVDAPPGTQVDIVYLYRNSAGHNIDISKIDWVLSRNNKANGSLTDILDVSEYKEGDLSYKFSNLNLVKSGIFKEYVGMGLLENNTQGVYILDRVTIKNPLNIDDVKAVLNSEGGVDIEIYIQNQSKEYLNNLKFSYGTHEEIFNLRAEEEYVIKFSIVGTSPNLGTFSIFNPNIKQICAVSGSAYYDYTNTDSIPVLAYRGTDIIPGAMIQPSRESFCIKRIAYTMISDEIVLSEMIKEKDEGEEVLGVQDEVRILPKTGQNGIWLLALLVVDALLWYSFFILRRNYESKNTNTRVRTKSS